MNRKNKKVDKKIMGISILSVTILTIIITLPLTFLIYNLKLENVSFLPNTFLKYLLSLLLF